MQFALAGVPETLVRTELGPGRPRAVRREATQRADGAGELIKDTGASAV